MEHCVTQNGEIVSREELIVEIERLLNAMPNSSTSLSREVMSHLSLQELESVRNSLLERAKDIVGHNREWLFSLVD